MESLYLLVPVSVGLVFAAIWVFFRMSDSGQFDDMVGPSLRILHDDDSVHEVDEEMTPTQRDSNMTQRNIDVKTEKKR